MVGIVVGRDVWCSGCAGRQHRNNNHFSSAPPATSLQPTSRLTLGPSWVLVLLNALETTVQERLLALEKFLHGQDDHPESQLRNVFTSKSTTVWHHSMAHALLNTRLHSFDSPIASEEERPPDTPAILLNFQDNRPENSPKTAIFGHLNRP